jgi:hypothetical protein
MFIVSVADGIHWDICTNSRGAFRLIQIEIDPPPGLGIFSIRENKLRLRGDLYF